MGTWGTGLFADDLAADVRDEYRDALADGLDGAAATDKVLTLFEDSLENPDGGPTLWLALAATQMRYGRLEQRVLVRALQMIDEGTDLMRFAGHPKLWRARERILDALRVQLLGRQRDPVKVRPYVPSYCDWAPGEIVGFQKNSGEWVTLHVQGIGETRRKDRFPVVCVLDIPFERVDEVTNETPVRHVFQLTREFAEARQRRRDIVRFGPFPDAFHIFNLKKRDLESDLIRKSEKRLTPKVTIKGEGILTGSLSTIWTQLNKFLDEHVG